MRDDGWHDYDGDLSSNNENSLTSSKAKKYTNRIFKDDIIYESNGPQSKADKRKRHQTPHPPRHHRHQHHRGNNKSGVERQNSRTHLINKDEISLGADNPGFASEESVTTINLPDDHPPGSLHRVSGQLRRFNSSSDADNPDSIFVISHDTVPQSKTLARHTSAPLDDHTYILATDADMEFNDDSVRDLLNLCNGDLRIGGACGRTHPIGQRSGPLVWYQMFEYAKGGCLDHCVLKLNLPVG